MTLDNEDPLSKIIHINVTERGQPTLNVKKHVWNEDEESWVNGISDKIGEVLDFRIILNYSGNTPIHDVIITDSFPDNLIYQSDASVPPTNNIGSIVEWSFSQMNPGDVIEIFYSAQLMSIDLDVDYENCINIVDAESFEGFIDSSSVLIVIKKRS